MSLNLDPTSVRVTGAQLEKAKHLARDRGVDVVTLLKDALDRGLYMMQGDTIIVTTIRDSRGRAL